MFHVGRQQQLKTMVGRFKKYGIYILLTVLILGPLLRRGYVLTLDMVFTPHLHMPTGIFSSYLLQVCLHVLNYVLPGDIVQKFVLFLALFLAGVGAHRLVSFITKPSLYQSIGNYFAGTFYMINPFTYDRFMAGQYDVLLGYALLPWFVCSLFKFIRVQSWRRSLPLALWATVTSIVLIHAIGFLVIFAVTALALRAWQLRGDKAQLKVLLGYSIASTTLYIILSSYWLVPLLLGRGSTASVLHNYQNSDQLAFATVGGDVFGRALSVLGLQGFWLELRHMYYLPQDTIPLWRLLAAIIWLLVIAGGVGMWRARQRFFADFFAITTVIATFFAIGMWNSWLAAHIPLFAGYREPGKFVAMVALSFTVFTGYGVSATMRYIYEQGGKAFFAFGSLLLLLIPLVWTPTMLWGFNHQLMPVSYPSDWYLVNRRLRADPDNFQVLFLPWHLYMNFGFAGRIIANPAPAFFDKPIIVSDNPEFKNISLTNRTPTKLKLDQILPKAATQNSLGTQLAKLHIKYVLLDKDDDYSNYAYLSHQHDLKQISNSDTLELYVNKAWGK